MPSAHTAVPDVIATSADVDALESVAAEAARTRLLAAVLCGTLIAVPFLAVRFPPVTDLPQHVAQIRLFLAALGDPDSAYRIQWFTPYSAAYAVLGAAWALSSPVNAGRLAVLALAILWTAAVHGLAARRQRSVAAAVLASVLVFNHALYWGFLSFVLGAVAFALWFAVTARGSAERWSGRDALLQLGAAALLYVSHALWFAVGIGWLLIYALVHRWPWRMALLRFASAAPVIAAAIVWYPHLEALGFVSPTVWLSSPLARLSPEWIVDASLGGIYGPAEYLVAGVLAAWIAGGLWQRRAALRTAADADLLWTGMFFIGLGVALPDQHMNTIQFAARWVPVGMVYLVLGAPAPSLLASLQRPLAMALLGVFCLTTGLAWMAFERDELSGLPDALAALPDEQRVIGLDLMQESRVIKGRPFLQTFAYAQVLHGGRLNASFAGFAPSLVIFRHQRPATWTPNLEWFAERVQRDDLRSFDYALINGTPGVHAQAAALPLAAVTGTGRWRLYRVVAAAP